MVYNQDIIFFSDVKAGPKEPVHSLLAAQRTPRSVCAQPGLPDRCPQGQRRPHSRTLGSTSRLNKQLLSEKLQATQTANEGLLKRETGILRLHSQPRKGLDVTGRSVKEITGSKGKRSCTVVVHFC